MAKYREITVGVGNMASFKRSDEKMEQKTERSPCENTLLKENVDLCNLIQVTKLFSTHSVQL